MCLTEFDETKWREFVKEELREEVLGEIKEEMRADTVLSLVKKGKVSVEDAAEELGLDIEATEKLLEEHGISIPSMV